MTPLTRPCRTAPILLEFQRWPPKRRAGLDLGEMDVTRTLLRSQGLWLTLTYLMLLLLLARPYA